MGWKVFAVVYTLFVAQGLFDTVVNHNVGVLNLASTALSVPATIALLLYAFDRRWLIGAPWKPIAHIYGAYSVWMIGHFLRGFSIKPIHNIPTFVGAIGAVATVIAIQYFAWLALRRYAEQSEVTPIPFH